MNTMSIRKLCRPDAPEDSNEAEESGCDRIEDMRASRWSVVDLFSGAGGASAGFHSHPDFSVVGAADAQMGKPSSAPGKLACNESYAENIGISPLEIDLGATSGHELRERLSLPESPTVLIACPPCTGFSRTNSKNHLQDDPRNSLIAHVAEFANALNPDIIIMENAREMLMGRFSHHFQALKEELEKLGYSIWHGTHYLTQFGLPQIRERALVIATRGPLHLHTLSELWSGFQVAEKSTHVRQAISELPQVSAGEICSTDPMHVSPKFRESRSVDRVAAIPTDGGSWRDLTRTNETRKLMTPVMIRQAEKGDFGSFPDVYGRLWWDRPSVTIKRECGHVGNGRYSHPEQNRLCTVREMGSIQGFPRDYTFVGSIGNRYRHIGDAVPPLISRQLASVCEWILTNRRPDISSAILENTHITESDIVREN